MGLFSKKGDKEKSYDKLPELPQLPKTLNFGQYQNTGMASERKPTFAQVPPTSLPSFPQSDNGNRWSMQAVKDAVEDHPSPSYNDYEDEEETTIPQNYDPKQNNAHYLENSGDKEVGGPRTQTYSSAPQPPIRKEPLFVRIDKFETALKNFEDIKTKVKHIEELITEIRELRIKEDKEFQDWERDLQTIKSRMNDIDKTLFDSLG